MEITVEQAAEKIKAHLDKWVKVTKDDEEAYQEIDYDTWVEAFWEYMEHEDAKATKAAREQQAR